MSSAAIWSVDDEGHLDLRYQVNLATTRLGEDEDRQLRHGLLLRKLVQDGQSAIVQPQSGSADDDEAGNPTDFLLVVGVVTIDGAY